MAKKVLDNDEKKDVILRSIAYTKNMIGVIYGMILIFSIMLITITNNFQHISINEIIPLLVIIIFSFIALKLYRNKLLKARKVIRKLLSQ